MNYALRDPALRAVVDRWIDSDDRVHTDHLLERLGADAAGRLSELAATADRNPPVLRQFDRDGNRVDEIDYHPAYLELCRAAYSEYGLSALSHRPIHGWEVKPPHLVKYLASYLFVQAEFGLACPVSMTDAAARTLRMFGDPATFGPWIDGLTSTDPENALHRRDVHDRTARRHRYRADRDRGRTRRQHLAAVGQEVVRLQPRRRCDHHAGPFPRRRPENHPRRRNVHGAQASSERGEKLVHDRPAQGQARHPLDAQRRGHSRRCVRVAGRRTRPRIPPDGRDGEHVAASNAMRSSALMRRAVRDAVDHTRERVVFGKALFDQPLMRATLLPLLLDAEAALALVGYTGDTLQRADAGDTEAQTLVRILTPVAKHFVCKRARVVTGEAMEIRGGNGYIEEWGFARLVRDSHLGSIWEGSSNVIALDVLRSMRKANAHRRLADAMCALLAGWTTRVAPVRPRCARDGRRLPHVATTCSPATTRTRRSGAPRTPTPWPTR